jgi:adenosylhomocysteinase
MSEIRNPELAPKGRQKIEWARRNMKLLEMIEKRFSRERPFSNLKVGISIHLEAKTARMAEVFRSGGASVAITGSNPMTVQDDVAAALSESGVEVFAWRRADEKQYENHLIKVLETRPNIIIDDGGDLTNLLHSKKTGLSEQVLGGCEETTTGIHRLKALLKEGKLKFPMFLVNDAKMKYLFDNRYGTGQSTWDGIMRATNLSIAGKTVVVAGYGWCGRGIALRAKGLGANVIVTEVNPVRAVEAVMDGFRVMKMEKAAEEGDIFVSSTGCRDIITGEMIEKMKDGAILANAGHFDVEIDKRDLEHLSTSSGEIKENIREYKLKNSKRIYLLAEGRLVNLVAGMGHPVEIMDTSFALQLLTAEHIVKNRDNLEAKLYPVPEEIDVSVAEMKLKALGIEIDSLTEEQKRYLESWRVG